MVTQYHPGPFVTKNPDTIAKKNWTVPVTKDPIIGLSKADV
jgi:hypothetical protein